MLERLQENAVRKRYRADAQSPSLLAGLIFDAAGESLTPSHANKQCRRYRYYVSRSLLRGTKSAATGAGGSRASSWRLPAGEIKGLVIDALGRLLRDRAGLADRLNLTELDPRALEQILFTASQLANELEHAADAARRAILTDLVDRINIESEAVAIRFDGRDC